MENQPREDDEQQRTDGPAVGVPPGGIPSGSLEVNAVRPYVGPGQSGQVVVVPGVDERVPEYE